MEPSPDSVGAALRGRPQGGGRPTSRVAIALGSNLGDRRAHLEYAVGRLRLILAGLRVSSCIETAPAGVTGAQPDYLNAACVGSSAAAPRELLDALRRIEADRGRERPYPNAPRTLDLDLILVGEAIVDEPDLAVPHARFRERAFVLGPLCEVAPDLVDPLTGLTVAQLHHRLMHGSRSRG